MFRQIENTVCEKSVDDFMTRGVTSLGAFYPETIPYPMTQFLLDHTFDFKFTADIVAKFHQGFCLSNPTTIRYSYSTPGVYSSEEYLFAPDYHLVDKEQGVKPFSHGAELLKKAFTAYERITNVRFIEDNHFPDIRFLQFSLKPDIKQGCDTHYVESFLKGFSLVTRYRPQGNRYLEERSVLFNAAFFASCKKLKIGARSYKTVLHEIGHAAMRFNHPFNKVPALSQKSLTSYSIMNYAHEIDRATGKPIYPITPMPVDMMGAQSWLGPNRTTGRGDTTYFLNEFIPASKQPYKTIASFWDVGGVDTLSAQYVGQQEITINLRPFSRSDLGEGYIALPDIDVENVISSRYANTIILNKLDNVADIRLATKPSTVVVDPLFCGHDSVLGFDVEKDKLIFERASPGTAEPWSLSKLDFCEVTLLREKVICKTATRIQFDAGNAIDLIDVNPDQLQFKNIVSRDYTDAVQCMLFNNSAAESNLLKTIFQQFPAEFLIDFKSAFLQGAAFSFLSGLGLEVLKSYQCSERQIAILKKVTVCLFILYAGSVLFNSGAGMTAALLDYVGFVENKALVTEGSDAMTAFISAPAKLTGALLGSRFGAKLSEAGFWGAKKIRHYFAARSQSENSENEKYFSCNV